jgi:hypothetical protein
MKEQMIQGGWVAIEDDSYNTDTTTTTTRSIVSTCNNICWSVPVCAGGP